MPGNEIEKYDPFAAERRDIWTRYGLHVHFSELDPVSALGSIAIEIGDERVRLTRHMGELAAANEDDTTQYAELSDEKAFVDMRWMTLKSMYDKILFNLSSPPAQPNDEPFTTAVETAYRAKLKDIVAYKSLPSASKNRLYSIAEQVHGFCYVEQELHFKRFRALAETQL